MSAKSPKIRYRHISKAESRRFFLAFIVSPTFLEQAVLTEFCGDFVCRPDHNDANDRFQQADGGGITEIGADHERLPVHISVDDIRHRIYRGGVQIEYLVERRTAHNAADLEDQHDAYRAADPRPSDVQHFLQPVCAVNARRFVQLRVDIGECGHIDDGVPAKFFPDVCDPDKGPKCSQRHQRGDGIKA